MIHSGLLWIFWGFLTSIFRINLGPVTIVPEFVSALLVAVGLEKMRKEAPSRSLSMAGNLSYCWIVLSLVTSALPWLLSNVNMTLSLTGTPGLESGFFSFSSWYQYISGLLNTLFMLLISYGMFQGVLENPKTSSAMRHWIQGKQRTVLLLFGIGAMIQTFDRVFLYAVFGAGAAVILAEICFLTFIVRLRKKIRLWEEQMKTEGEKEEEVQLESAASLAEELEPPSSMR